LVVQGWRARAAAPWYLPGEWIRSPRHVLAFCTVIGGVVFYMLVAERLGFLITSTLVLTALMCALRVRPGRSVLIALIATLVIHTLFYKLLRVPLPWGVLTPWAW
jgi:putative tricarboxylic transport membrane protein